MNCHNCKNEIEQNSKFCGHCGVQIQNKIKNKSRSKLVKSIGEIGRKTSSKLKFLVILTILVSLTIAGIHFNNKQDQIEDLNFWELAKKENTSSSAERYLIRYPDGNHVDEAVKLYYHRREYEETEQKRIREIKERKLLKLEREAALVWPRVDKFNKNDVLNFASKYKGTELAEVAFSRYRWLSERDEIKKHGWLKSLIK